MNAENSQPAGDAEGNSDLAALSEEIAARMELGERVDIEAYAALHPAHADALRGLLPTIEELVAVGRATSQYHESNGTER